MKTYDWLQVKEIHKVLHFTHDKVIQNVNFRVKNKKKLNAHQKSNSSASKLFDMWRAIFVKINILNMYNNKI